MTPTDRITVVLDARAVTTTTPIKPGDLKSPIVESINSETSTMLAEFAFRILKPLRAGCPVRRRRRQLIPVMVAVIEKLELRRMLSGAGLTIVPTFDSNITSDPNHAAIEATINSVISEYKAVFSDPITVNITFKEESSGLGNSNFFFDTVPYSQFLAALKTSQSTSNDAIALAHLPNSSTDPVVGHDNIEVSTANEKALGLIAADGSALDGTVLLNTSVCNLNRANIDPNKYDLAAITAHEVDEVLGFGSSLDQGSSSDISPEDLFRYDPNGNRSYTTDANAHAFFSLDGTADLIQFNQSGGGSDYGDWAPGSTAHVQDAFGTTGVVVNPTIEFVALDVIGYHFLALATHPPVGTSNTVTTLENASLTFASADFGFTDPNNTPPNTFTSVKITTLPGVGTLKDNGTAVTAGQFVSVADITGGKLIFTPVTFGTGANYANYTFQVQDDGSTANGGVNLDPNPKTMTINVTPVNQAPMGVSNTVSSFVNSPYSFRVSDFGFTDPHDNPPDSLLAIKISTLPQVGSLTDNGANVAAGAFVDVADITNGKFVFTPLANGVGAAYTRFTFQVQDNGGTENGGIDIDSTPRIMTIAVTTPSANHAPVGTSGTLTTIENTAYAFKTSDFGFTDPRDNPPNTLLAVTFPLLSAYGTLTDNGLAVTVNQFVSAADINAGKLVFAPTSNLVGGPLFLCKFQVQDNGGTAGGGSDLDPNPKVLDVNIVNVNHAPVGTSGTVTTAVNAAYTLKIADFGFTDPNDHPPNTLLAVKFSLLSAYGTLTDNGVAVTVNQFVSAADISAGKLVFTPNANTTGQLFLCKFQVQDNGGTSGGGADLDPNAKILDVNITQANHAPVGTSGTVTTGENRAYTFKTTDFGFKDPNDSPPNRLLAVKFTLLTAYGTLKDNGVAVTMNQSVSAADISSGKLIFTPKSNVTGLLFLCKFQVQDNGGTARGGVDLDPIPKILDIRIM